MAKSTRSKVKRHFRAKKRHDGVYAATEAARLHRLSMKLRALVASDEAGAEEGKEDAEMAAEGEGEEGAQGEWADDAGPVAAGSSPSPFWLAALGLVDPRDITAERMAELCAPWTVDVAERQRSRGASDGHRGGWRFSGGRGSRPDGGLDHLFRGLPQCIGGD